MSLRPLLLSEFDPEVEGESGIDPLGTGAIYDRLANRILPGLTVRMSRPRFLTAMALGAVVCEVFEEDTVAADGTSSPWLVFEWYVIESMVRAHDKLRDDHRIPGRLKVEAALRQRRPVCAATYLKTATVFGFTGIYRRLASALGILTDELVLDDAGYELVAAWERDQGMEGFRAEARGAGASLREQMRRAVTQGVEVGHTVRMDGAFYEQVAALTEPATAGRAETNLLVELLRRPKVETAIGGELVAAIEKEGKTISRHDEPPFLRGLTRAGSEELRLRLNAIDAFESLCRPLTDSFDTLRRLSSENGRGPVGLTEFASSAAKSDLVGRVQAGVSAIRKDQMLLEWERPVRALVDCFEPAKDADALFRALLDRHEATQAEKPPHGKRSWFERVNDGLAVRPTYALDETGLEPPAYDHDYRTTSLSWFLKDLRRVS